MKKIELKQIIRECLQATLEEDGGQGGPGAPGTGMGNVTANVDSIQVPQAFKHPKDIKAEGTEDEDPLYVEFHSERQGEEPFMLHGQKYQYVNAKYPNGKVDVAVYAFAGDMVYGYNAFRQRMGIKEEEQPEPYDAETDQFAPGPRQRPEDWKSVADTTSVPKLQDLLKPRS